MHAPRDCAYDSELTALTVIGAYVEHDGDLGETRRTILQAMVAADDPARMLLELTADLAAMLVAEMASRVLRAGSAPDEAFFLPPVRPSSGRAGDRR